MKHMNSGMNPLISACVYTVGRLYLFIFIWELAYANPLRNKFILGNINVYLHVLTLFDTVAQIVYIHFIEDRGIFTLHYQISLLLVGWCL